MVFVMMALATAVTVFWVLQLTRVSQDDWIAAAYAQVIDNRLEIEKIEERAAEKEAQLAQYHGVLHTIMKLVLDENPEKQIVKLKKNSDALQNGDLRSLNILMIPGYVLLRKVDSIGHGMIHKNILSNFTELYGRKYAPNKTKQLLAKLVSYPIIGLAAVLWLGAILLVIYGLTVGLLLSLLLVLVLGVLVYAMYDETGDQVKKRRKEIARQFPNVVSKLALLVTSGMIMDRAWEETAASQNGVLYREMRYTSMELANLVGASSAYTNFINRCNTKETTKLASAIIQSQSKGNAEIGVLLRGMSHEAWLERRHMAKRDSEVANSKLSIPSMMMFVAILIMIMVPVAMSFSNL